MVMVMHQGSHRSVSRQALRKPAAAVCVGSCLPTWKRSSSSCFLGSGEVSEILGHSMSRDSDSARTKAGDCRSETSRLCHHRRMPAVPINLPSGPEGG